MNVMNRYTAMLVTILIKLHDIQVRTKVNLIRTKRVEQKTSKTTKGHAIEIERTISPRSRPSSCIQISNGTTMCCFFKFSIVFCFRNIVVASQRDVL